MSRGRQAALLTVLAGGLSVDGLTAHHSLSAAYDTTRSMTLQAEVQEFHFVNPHPYLVVEARSGGAEASWRLELDNRGELLDAGMTSETFRRGDRVVVTGAPGRRGAAMLYVRELDRPADGFRYEQVSATPRITRRPAAVP